MPFTPYHLGPALLIGSLLGKRLHLLLFMVASIIVDVEPFLVLALGLRYPLHGYGHTFLGALLIGIISALSYDLLFEGRLQRWQKRVKLYIATGVSGTLIHILLDSPLYRDIRPFWPLPLNPLYNPHLSPLIYGLCTVSFILGLAIYAFKRAPSKKAGGDRRVSRFQRG